MFLGKLNDAIMMFDRALEINQNFAIYTNKGKCELEFRKCTHVVRKIL